MILEVNKKRFTVICDSCKADLRDEGYGRIWEDEQTAFSNAEASSWSLENGEYCYECVSAMPKISEYKHFVKSKINAIESFVFSIMCAGSAVIIFFYDGKEFRFKTFDEFEMYALENKIDVCKFERFEIHPF